MLDPLLLPLALASQATYAGGRPWFVNETNTCQVFKSAVNDHPCYAFEGTSDWQEWIVDFFALDVRFYQHPKAGPVHLGFWLDIADAVRFIAADLISIGRPGFYITGQSKGGGEGVLCHAELKSLGLTPLATRVFEPPKVGTSQLSSYLAGDDIGWTQTFNAEGSDLVTQVPPWPEWCHQGRVTRLQVPDSYGIRAKHVVGAQVEVLQVG
jgi:hypothetical protein